MPVKVGTTMPVNYEAGQRENETSSTMILRADLTATDDGPSRGLEQRSSGCAIVFELSDQNDAPSFVCDQVEFVTTGGTAEQRSAQSLASAEASEHGCALGGDSCCDYFEVDENSEAGAPLEVHCPDAVPPMLGSVQVDQLDVWPHSRFSGAAPVNGEPRCPHARVVALDEDNIVLNHEALDGLASRQTEVVMELVAPAGAEGLFELGPVSSNSERGYVG